MAKERRDRSMSADRSRTPFLCCSSLSRYQLQQTNLEKEENMKEWEEARCPVCIEHPHNAILLLCASHDKGCRPFMCDTSYRHSNCFDQFQKSFMNDPQALSNQENSSISASHLLSHTLVADSEITNPSVGNEEGSSSINTLNTILPDKQDKPKLMCPLCRGEINGSIIVDSARCFMNAKSRSCACETCEFSGTYSDLRKHARKEHPFVRPTETDPERQRNWRRLERQRDIGDLLSTLQSSVGEERVQETSEFDEGGRLTVFFLVRILRPEGSSRSNSRSGFSRARVTLGRRSRRLWGESYDGEAELRDEENETLDGTSEPSRRLRRRTTPEN